MTVMCFRFTRSSGELNWGALGLNGLLSIQKFKNVEAFSKEVTAHLKYRCLSQQVNSSKIATPIDEADVFGTLEKPKNEFEFYEGDEDDKKVDDRLIIRGSQRKIDIEYAKQIKQLLKGRKLSEALGILDNGNISKPSAYLYGLLIRSCGKFGYTKKAFKLYNEMKKRGMKPRASIYTSLFNACSHSPWKEDGLSRASQLLESLESIGYEPNIINYNAMIKAFGRCGDLEVSFRLVDQMISKGIPPDSSTFAFLLQACASDQESGFRHAILVWDKMLSKGIQPSLYTYNLLLRCCKDCESGEGVDIRALSSWNSLSLKRDHTKFISTKEDIMTINSGNIETIIIPEAKEEGKGNQNINEAENTPKHVFQEVSGKEQDGDMVTKLVSDEKKVDGSKIFVTSNNYLVVATSPKDRLQCLGGCDGLLKQMSLNNIKPDIKTFTQLLEVIPSTETAEQSLLVALKDNGSPPDVEFYNMLMKKRIMRFDYIAARSVLQLMASSDINPNVMTFGILALGCTNKEESEKFLKEVKEAGFRINAEMIGGLLSGACYRWDIMFVLELMELCIQEEIRPNEKLISHLKQFRSKLNKAVKISEDQNQKLKFTIKAFNIYKMRLTSWLKEIDLSEADPQHPWDQFRRHLKSSSLHL